MITLLQITLFTRPAPLVPLSSHWDVKLMIPHFLQLSFMVGDKNASRSRKAAKAATVNDSFFVNPTDEDDDDDKNINTYIQKGPILLIPKMMTPNWTESRGSSPNDGVQSPTWMLHPNSTKTKNSNKRYFPGSSICINRRHAGRQAGRKITLKVSLFFVVWCLAARTLLRIVELLLVLSETTATTTTTTRKRCSQILEWGLKRRVNSFKEGLRVCRFWTIIIGRIISCLVPSDAIADAVVGYRRHTNQTACIGGCTFTGLAGLSYILGFGDWIWWMRIFAAGNSFLPWV